jgi:hypothetical protein
VAQTLLSDDSDFVVVIWENRKSGTGRLFETISKYGSQFPVAWRFLHLQTKYSGLLPNARIVQSEQELLEWCKPPLIHDTDRDKPLIVPVRFARVVLGWENFDVWEVE